MNPFCGNPNIWPQHSVYTRFPSCRHLHSFQTSRSEFLSFLARWYVGAGYWSPLPAQKLCQPRPPNSQTIKQVDLHWLPPESRQRQYFWGIPRANQASDSTVGVGQTRQPIYDAADNVLCPLRHHQMVCLRLTRRLWHVASPHTPPWTSLFTLSTFVSFWGVLTTPSFRFCNLLIWGETWGPQRACTCLGLRVFNAWTFYAPPPSYLWIAGLRQRRRIESSWVAGCR